MSAEDHVELVDQPKRLSIQSRPAIVRCLGGRFITAAQTAALLEVTEGVLWRWRVLGQGPQPVLRPEGRLYAAERIKRLAAMPRERHMLAISRSGR
jgi:hypothetical protein